MRDDEQRIFRTFEEFEREELRRMESVGASVDEMIASLFGAEGFEVGEVREGVWALDRQDG